MTTDEQSFERWGTRLRGTAATFSYPPTPDIAAAVRRRLMDEPKRRAIQRLRIVWVTALAILLLASVFAVPEVRAALRFFQIGAVRIILPEPTTTPTMPAAGLSQPAQPTIRATVALTATATTTATFTATPTPTATRSLLKIFNEMSLQDAERLAGFKLKLPAYPPDIGLPDRVALQSFGGPVVVLVWLEPGTTDQVRFILYELGPGVFVEKLAPTVLKTTSVNGHTAAWTEGQHLLQFMQSGGGIIDPGREIEGHVLIWSDGPVTYRLENKLALEEAIRIAESIPPQPAPTAVPTSSALYPPGHTTLVETQNTVRFKLKLPTYPYLPASKRLAA